MIYINAVNLRKYFDWSFIFLAFTFNLSIAWSSIALGICVFFGLLLAYKTRLEIHLDKNFKNIFCFFFAVLLISALLSQYPLDGIKRIITYLVRTLPFFLAIIFVDNIKQIKYLIFAMLLSLFINSLYTIFQGLTHTSRASGFGNIPIMTMAGLFTLQIPFLITLIFDKHNFTYKQRSLMGVVFVIATTAMIFNNTRGAMLAVTCTIILLFFYNFFKRRKTFYFIGLLITLGFLPFLYANVPDIEKNFLAAIKLSDVSSQERLLLWQSSLKMFKDYPLLGVGTGNFANFYQQIYILPEAKLRFLDHAHNNFFHMLAETGIVGLTSFICFFAAILWCNYKYYKQNNSNFMAFACFFTTIAFLLYGFTEFDFGTSAIMRVFWFMNGLSFAYAKFEQKQAL